MGRIARLGLRLANSGLGRYGHEIRRRLPDDPKPPATVEPLHWVRDTQAIQTVIDIGANNGDFAAFLSRFLGATEVYAFEPLGSCQADLRAKAGSIPGLHVFEVALSDGESEETFYENSYGPSSSLLHVADIHKREFPHTAGETPSRVRTARLDDVLDVGSLKKNVFVKLDVQGFEDRVILGGRAVFSIAQCVLVEMSFEEMYRGQPLFEPIHDLLVGHGLRFIGIKNQINSTTSGQPLFAHCLYVRPTPGEATDRVTASG